MMATPIASGSRSAALAGALGAAGREPSARVPAGQEVARHPEAEDHRADGDVASAEAPGG